MSKYSRQDLIEETSKAILKRSLDPNFFLVSDFGEKDNFPDIDGQIRLRDGNRNYENKYLHYQLKGTERLKNHKYFCRRAIIDYCLETNVPTILFVVEISTENAYWYFFNENRMKELELHKDKKGRTLDLSDNNMCNNSPELNQEWSKIAKKDDYDKVSSSLAEIARSYHENVTKCVGLLYLLRKEKKSELAVSFNKILGIGMSEVELIIQKLSEEEVITSTVNLYLVENEQLGKESLFVLLDDLNLNELDKFCRTKEEKLLVLGQLAKIEHKRVKGYLNGLSKELKKSIKRAKTNDDIFMNLEFLETYAYRAADDTLRIIDKVINSKEPLPQETIEGSLIPYKGKSHDDLVIKCIEILQHIRYAKPTETLSMLVLLSKSPDKEIRKKTAETLDYLCQYDIDVLRKAGYYFQSTIIGELEKWTDSKLLENADIAIEACAKFLEPSFEGQSMQDYRTLTISFGPLIVTDDLKKLRSRTISILQRLYGITAGSEATIRILDTLEQAAQTPDRGDYSADMEQMVLDNTSAIINFYITIASTSRNEELKQIEKQVGWFNRRFAGKKLSRLGELESIIASNIEYQTFRILVGYDHEFNKDLDWKEAELARRKKIQEFVDGMSMITYKDWQAKILQVASYSPNTAGEFQYFNIFLNDLGKQKPDVALRLIDEDIKELQPFLIHLVAGIWESKLAGSAKKLVSKWVKEEKYLSICATVFDYVKRIDKPLLDKIFQKAKANRDIDILNSIITAIVGNYPKCKSTKALFVKVVKELTKNKNCNWVSIVWYRTDTIIGSLASSEVDVILENLLLAPRIDYDAERMLAVIAEKHPAKTIKFFEQRLSIKTKNEKQDCRYDAVPYHFHELNKSIGKHARTILPLTFAWFHKRHWRYRWEGSRFISGVFPSFDRALEKELILLVRTGRMQDLKIVMAVLKAYEGQKFLHNTCKEIVKRFGKNKKVKEETFFVLSHIKSAMGEYGFVDAYKQKKEDVQEWKLDKDANVRAFAKEYEEFLDKRIAYEKKRADEDIKLMKKGLS